MKRSRKPNRVSWAQGVNLCQVKLFSSEDCPSNVGLKSQDHLQAKTSWMLHSNSMESNDLPPGFDVSHFENQMKKELFHIPQIKWKCPPKFVMSCTWQVVAGEESKEVEVQKLREIRVLEAVYPRLSAIPPSPSVNLDIENVHNDDSLTPLVPINPIEEEEYAEISSNLAAPMNNPVCSQPLALPEGQLASKTLDTPKSPVLEAPASEKPTLGTIPNRGADLTAAAAASAAVAAIMKSNEQGGLIDTDLLIKILSDPKMIQKLVNDHGPAVDTVSAPANTVSTPANFVTAPTNKVSTPANSVTAPTNTVSTPANSVSSPMSGLNPVTPLVHRSKPVTQLVHAPSALPDIPRHASGNSYNFLKGVRPTLNTTPQHTVPVCGVKQVFPLSCPEPNVVLSTKPANVNFYTLPNQVRPSLSAMPAHARPNSVPIATFIVKEAQPVKDANYYKNLIRQHGGEKQETHNPIIRQNVDHGNYFQDLKLVQNVKSGELKPKNQKPCMYFKSSKGCRNGINCPFQHDISVQWRVGNVLEVRSAKRMKLGGEITGRI